MQRAHELRELGVIQVLDCPERHPVPIPWCTWNPRIDRGVGGRRIGGGPDEHVDRMEAPLIDEHGDGLAGNVIEPAANQGKTDGR